MSVVAVGDAAPAQGLSQACAASIAQVMQQHAVLQQVQLSRNNLTDAGEPALQRIDSCSSSRRHLMRPASTCRSAEANTFYFGYCWTML
jgi:hypothetical protein